MIKLIDENSEVKTVVVGIGDVGNDVINCMLDEEIGAMKFVHINTKEKAVESGKTFVWTSIDKEVATEDKIECEEIIKDADMVFVICDMDSENKIQVFSDVAQFSKNQGILTIGMLAMSPDCKINNPLLQMREVLNEEEERCLVETENCESSTYTGSKMMITMNENSDWKKCVDTLFIVPLQDVSGNGKEFISQGIKNIVDAMNESSLIQLDFQDIITIMKDKGLACMGIGRAKGADKGIEAAKKAVEHSPLLKENLSDAKIIMVNIIGDVSLIETNDAISYIYELAGGKDILFSMRYEETLVDEIIVACIATGNEILCKKIR